MIFTKCPYCDDDLSYGWECEDTPPGFGAHRCEKCGDVMWIQHTSICGKTQTHGDFMRDLVKPRDAIKCQGIYDRLKVIST